MGIRAMSANWNTSIDLLIQEQRGDSLYVVKGVAYSEQPQHKIITPSLNVDIQDAQILIDDLWLCGLRPSEGTGSAGSLKATENHLKDMRKIVFKKLGID